LAKARRYHLGQPHRLARIDARQDGGELLPAESRDDAAAIQTFLRPRREQLEHAVTLCMA
jgi:hypothetical protein